VVVFEIFENSNHIMFFLPRLSRRTPPNLMNMRWKNSSSSSSNTTISPIVAVVGGAFTLGLCVFWGSGGRSGTPYAFAGDRAVSFLRLLDPETAHKVTVMALKYGFGTIDANMETMDLSVRLWGKTFPNCVGMAAGFDKQGEVMGPLLNIGFGFVEIGGVTPLPQDGNPRPRMFRLPEDRALINRFGLNSEGADVVSERVKSWNSNKQSKGIVGVNMAKTTGSTSALEDYRTGARKFGADADFVVLNFSCPNVKWTKNLGKGKGKETIRNIVRAVQDELKRIDARASLLIKLGPDMTMEEKREMASMALETGVDGLIVSNTSSRRPSDLQSLSKMERGGLSGKPIRDMANETLRDVYRMTNGKIPIVGCGGICNADDAYERIRNGASLIQLYTALVYEGPSLIPRIKKGLQDRLRRDGFECIEDAVGVDVKLS
jgi:dihydroorotate dehydrogenase